MVLPAKAILKTADIEVPSVVRKVYGNRNDAERELDGGREESARAASEPEYFDLDELAKEAAESATMAQPAHKVKLDVLSLEEIVDVMLLKIEHGGFPPTSRRYMHEWVIEELCTLAGIPECPDDIRYKLMLHYSKQPFVHHAWKLNYNRAIYLV
ncbi:hypothetical protein HDK64DRAFT_313384 [Phyllosticta capitalensis]